LRAFERRLRLDPPRLLGGRCGGFSRRCSSAGRGFDLGYAAGERSDDAPVLAVGFFEGPDSILQLGYQEVRTVVRLVGGRTRLVGLGNQDVDRPAFAFYRECAATYAATHGLGADT